MRYQKKDQIPQLQSTRNGFHLLKVTSEVRKVVSASSQMNNVVEHEREVIVLRSIEGNKLHNDSQGASLQIQEATQTLATIRSKMLSRENLYPVTTIIVKI